MYPTVPWSSASHRSGFSLPTPVHAVGGCSCQLWKAVVKYVLWPAPLEVVAVLIRLSSIFHFHLSDAGKHWPTLYFSRCSLTSLFAKVQSWALVQSNYLNLVATDGNRQTKFRWQNHLHCLSCRLFRGRQLLRLAANSKRNILWLIVKGIFGSQLSLTTVYVFRKRKKKTQARLVSPNQLGSTNSPHIDKIYSIPRGATEVGRLFRPKYHWTRVSACVIACVRVCVCALRVYIANSNGQQLSVLWSRL